MATTTILQLPQAVSLTGAEYLEASQNGASVRVLAQQIAALSASMVPTGPIGLVVATPSAGANNNYNAGGSFGVTTGFLDLNPPGVSNITGLAAGFDGQIAVITNLSAFALTLNALNAGSLAANQFRLSADLTLSQYASASFKYSVAIGKWVPL